MKKATKIALLQDLEKLLSDEEKQFNPSQDNSQVVLVIDVMANLRKFYMKSYKTFGELGLAFVFLHSEVFQKHQTH